MNPFLKLSIVERHFEIFLIDNELPWNIAVPDSATVRSKNTRLETNVLLYLLYFPKENTSFNTDFVPKANCAAIQTMGGEDNEQEI